MKVLIAPANTDLNRGDQALVWETIKIIEDIYENTEITLIAFGNNKKEIDLQTNQSLEKGYQFIKPLIPHPGRVYKDSGNKVMKLGLWGIRAILDIFPRLLIISNNSILNKIGYKLLNGEDKKLVRNYEEFDLYVYKGGGFLHSYGSVNDAYIILYHLYYALFAKKYNKKILFMPNSYGPFKNKWAKKLYIKIMNKVDYISARERVSANLNNNLLEKKTDYYPDLGFYIQKVSTFNPEEYFENNSIFLNSDKNIGITVRPYRFDGHSDPKKAYNSYIKSIAEFVKKYHLTYNIVFIAQTMGPSNHENDNIAINDVINLLNDEKFFVISDYALDANKMVNIYSEMDFVIGTRFHSVIFSFTQSVPCLAISYGGNKGKGIMNDFNLSKYEINISDVTFESLDKMFSELVIDKDVTSRIDKKINEYWNERPKLVKRLSEIIGD